MYLENVYFTNLYVHNVHMKDSIYKKIGQNIKKYREINKLTQQELANKIGKGLNFVGKIEIAFSRPSLNTLIDISFALDIELKDLLTFDK